MTPVIKICGLSTAAALDAALDAGADTVGFVFFPKSPRHVDWETARAVGQRARGRAKIVALSVDAGDETLKRIVDTLAPDLMQLHGSETPARVQQISELCARPTMKAIGVAAREDFAQADPYDTVADLMLIDAKPPRDAALPGGNGRPRKSIYRQSFNRALQDQRRRPPTHRRHRHAVDHNDVLAQLSFGTWNSLLPRKDDLDPSGIGPENPRRLWTEALHQGFPHHDDPIAIKYWVERLYRLRNRVAHLEPLCDTDVMSYHRTTARLLRSIEPAIAEWYAGISRVPAVYQARPAIP